MLQIPRCSIYDPAEERGGTVATCCTGLPAPLALPPYSFLPSPSALGVQRKALLQGEELLSKKSGRMTQDCFQLPP